MCSLCLLYRRFLKQWSDACNVCSHKHDYSKNMHFTDGNSGPLCCWWTSTHKTVEINASWQSVHLKHANQFMPTNCSTYKLNTTKLQPIQKQCLNIVEHGQVSLSHCSRNRVLTDDRCHTCWGKHRRPHTPWASAAAEHVGASLHGTHPPAAFSYPGPHKQARSTGELVSIENDMHLIIMTTQKAIRNKQACQTARTCAQICI